MYDDVFFLVFARDEERNIPIASMKTQIAIPNGKKPLRSLELLERFLLLEKSESTPSFNLVLISTACFCSRQHERSQKRERERERNREAYTLITFGFHPPRGPHGGSHFEICLMNLNSNSTSFFLR